MSGASDELREFGDMIDAGQGSKIKEPEPSGWEEQRAAAYWRHLRSGPVELTTDEMRDGIRRAREGHQEDL